MTERLDAIRVFISYARLDAAVADSLVADLEARGITVTIDRRDLPFGEEWEKELAGFIRDSDTVLWLVSQASVASRWCNWELGEVQRTSKRLVPVRIEPVAPDALPDALGRLHLLPAEGTFDPALHLDALVDTLQTDISWIKDHTRLAGDAAEWTRNGRSSDLLLRGRGLTDAEAWRDRRPASAPPASADTLDLILQSRRGATRRLRLFGVVATVIAFVLAGLALTAVSQRNAADEQRGLAEAAQVRAESEASRAAIAAESASLQREVALAQVESAVDPMAGLDRTTKAAARNLAASKAGTIPMLPEIHAGMLEMLANGRELPPLWVGGEPTISDVRQIAVQHSINPDAPNSIVVAAREQVSLIDETGKLLAPPIAGRDLGPIYANAAMWEDAVDDPFFVIATGEMHSGKVLNPGVAIYDHDGALLDSYFEDNDAPFTAVTNAYTENLVIAGDSRGSLFAIDLSTHVGKRLLDGSGRSVRGLAYSALSSKLVVIFGSALPDTVPPPASNEWGDAVDVVSIIAALKAEFADPDFEVIAIGTESRERYGCAIELPSHAFGGLAATCDPAGGVTVWSPATSQSADDFGSAFHYGVESGSAVSIAYSDVLDAIAIADSDGTIRLQTTEGTTLIPPLRDPLYEVTALAFSKDGSTLLAATASDTDIIRRWDLSDLVWGQGAERYVNLGAVAVTSGGEKVYGVEARDDSTFLNVYDADRTLVFEGQLTDSTDTSQALLSVSADGSRIAVAMPGGIGIADLSQDADNYTFIADDEGSRLLLMEMSVDGHSLLTSHSPDGESFLTWYDPKQTVAPIVRTYDLPADLADTKMSREWTDNATTPLTSVTALPRSAERSAETYATGDGGGTVTVRNATGEALWTAENVLGDASEKMAVSYLAASSDGTTLAAVIHPFRITFLSEGVADAHFAAWSRASRKSLGTMAATRWGVSALALSDDGKFLAAVGRSIRRNAASFSGNILLYQTAGLRSLGATPIASVAGAPDVLWFAADEKLHGINRSFNEREWPVEVTQLIAAAQIRLAPRQTLRQFQALLDRTSAAQSAKDTATAAALYKQATVLFPSSTPVWVQLGNASYDLVTGVGDIHAALSAYDRALVINPYQFDALRQRGRLRYIAGDFESSIADNQLALTRPNTGNSINPERLSSDSLEKQMTDRLAAYYRPMAFIAYAEFELGKPAEALAALQPIFAQQRQRARDHEIRARAEAALGRYALALAEMDKAIQKLQGEAGSYSSLAPFLQRGEKPAGRQALICQLARDAADWAGLDRRLWLERAATACQESIRLDATSGLGHNTLLSEIEALLAAI